MSGMRVVLSGSLLSQFAEAQVDNRRDSRAVAQAGAELAVEAEARRVAQQQAANEAQLAQGSFSTVMQVVGIAVKTRDAVQSGQTAAAEVSRRGELDAATRAAAGGRAAGADAAARGDAGEVSRAGRAETRDPGRLEALMDTVLTDQGTRVRDRFSEAQLELLLRDAAGEPLTRQQLLEAGFSEPQAEAILERQGEGVGLDASQVAELVFAGRMGPADQQAALDQRRQGALINLAQQFTTELFGRGLAGRTEGARRSVERAGEDRDRGREIRTGILATRQDDTAQLLEAGRALRRDRGA
jgi:hypothetical protein